MTVPLIVTADDTVLDALLRVTAAAGCTPDVVRDVSAALRGWQAASLVLVGADLADAVARAAPVRREGVLVVLVGPSPDPKFEVALRMGAESVAELPRAEGWLTERVTDVIDTGPARGLTIGVVGGSGGAGATTFACALAQVAARAGAPAVVVDTDPLGPGADRVLGLELVEGVRWGELSHSSGRLGARALRDSLPRRDAVSVLTWYGGAAEPVLDPATAREALSAARRGHDTVVVDLCRSLDPLVTELAARCDQLVVVVSASVPGVAAAVRVCGRLSGHRAVGLVVRGSGVDAESLGRLVRLPVLAQMADQRGLAEAIDLGLGPVRSRRGPLGRAATDVLAAVTQPLAQAA